MTALKLFSILALATTATAFQQLQPPQWKIATALKATIDERKIEDAATHFGKYPLKEIEAMKNELHKERIQSLMFDRNAVNGEKAAEQRLMEQELDLQLSLLKKELKPDPNLFPKEMVKDLPHLKDGAMAVEGVDKQQVFMLEQEALLEENVLETVAFCSILALFMVAPQLLH